jgi:hypothetical protein
MFLEQFVLTAAKVFKKFITVDGLHPAAFQVVIAAVEHVPGLRKVIKVSLDNISNKLGGISASALRGEVIELLFRLGREVYFHALQNTGKPGPWATKKNLERLRRWEHEGENGWLAQVETLRRWPVLIGCY